MAKRKVGVNNIIYELDNEDLTASSDDEGKESKIICTEQNKVTNNAPNASDNVIEITDDELLSNETSHKNLTNEVTDNGGKAGADNLIKEIDRMKFHDEGKSEVNGSFNNGNKSSNEICKTIIFNEDIDIDSPASNSDLGVVGCENRTPLVSVRFKDNMLAKNYKKKVKEFMLNLIKLHETESLTAESDTDIELDIWPEDLSEEEFELPVPLPEDDNLFFVDTDPKNFDIDVPMYEQASLLISNPIEKETSSPQVVRRGPTCFNCDGAHSLRECTLPRNNARIAENRRNIGVKLGRYHVEDDQKFGHLIPGRISGHLRNALGLKRNEIPMHIYRMRLMGYPPGWLEEARISHSGIAMFDSTGHAILDPEDEEGEVCEPGSKDKFDIKKILDFPGFNVPASSRYREECHLYGFPPMSDQDSKMMMLQMLAPNAMKAYKRKKLTIFPSSANNSLQEGQAEMDLDSGDENPGFPSVPPLPDDEPPALPPPPSAPPPAFPPLPSSPPPEYPKPKQLCSVQSVDKENDSDKSQSDIEIIEIIQVPDIPIPEDDLITIDDDDDEISTVSSGRNSPSIDDLEAKKRQLLNAIKLSDTATDSGTEADKELDISEDMSDIKETNTVDFKEELHEDIINISAENVKPSVCIVNVDGPSSLASPINESEIPSGIAPTLVGNKPPSGLAPTLAGNGPPSGLAPALAANGTPSKSAPPIITENEPDHNVNKTPDTKTGLVKDTQYGTPVMNIASPYLKLPSDDKFAKDICDIIQFENLPNSVGKYKKICGLLKKVKSEVDRIQES